MKKSKTKNASMTKSLIWEKNITPEQNPKPETKSENGKAIILTKPDWK